MGISGSVTATYQGSRAVYFSAQQIFAGGGQTGSVFANPWSVVEGDLLFGYYPTTDSNGKPVAGFGNLAANVGKGNYNFSPWEFGNQSLNNSPQLTGTGGILINGNLYGSWNNGLYVGSWQVANNIKNINPIYYGMVGGYTIDAMVSVNGEIGAVTSAFADGSAVYSDVNGQSILPAFWDITEVISTGGVIYNGVNYLISTDSGLAQRVQVIVKNGAEQYRRYMYLDDPTYNDIINGVLYSPYCIFSFSNGYMIARSPYLPGQIIVINGDCSKWWLYNCLPVNKFAAEIFSACANNWGQVFAPHALMSPLGYLTLSGFSVSYVADIYSSFVFKEVNPNTLANPGRRLPIANCWNCLPNAQGHR